jgi:hypothetical protein
LLLSQGGAFLRFCFAISRSCDCVVISRSCDCVVISHLCDCVVISPSCNSVVTSPSCDSVVISPSCDSVVISPSCNCVVISPSCDSVYMGCFNTFAIFCAKVASASRQLLHFLVCCTHLSFAIRLKKMSPSPATVCLEKMASHGA